MSTGGFPGFAVVSVAWSGRGAAGLLPGPAHLGAEEGSHHRTPTPYAAVHASTAHARPRGTTSRPCATGGSRTVSQ